MSRSSAAMITDSKRRKKPPMAEKLVPLLADLQRQHHAPARAEVEGNQRVRDRRPHPVRQDQVGRAQLRQVILAGLPARRVVGLAAPVEVAHIAQHHAVVLDPRLQQARHVVGPDALVRRLDGVPPAQQCQQRGAEGGQPQVPGARTAAQAERAQQTVPSSVHAATGGTRNAPAAGSWNHSASAPQAVAAATAAASSARSGQGRRLCVDVSGRDGWNGWNGDRLTRVVGMADGA